MKYMLLVYGAEDAWTDAERTACVKASLVLCDELAAQGRYLDAAPLQPAATAVTVRVRGGDVLVTDGPFAETTEQLGGYFVLDLPDLDEAIAVASRLPGIARSTVEIRPLLALDGLPPSQPAAVATGTGRTPFMLLSHDDEAAWRAAGPEAMTAAMSEAAALCRELSAAGAYLSASPLHPSDTATCVRVRDGRRTVTDGPFTEAREVLGGYYLVLAESASEAAAVAARHPGLRFGTVEVRPVVDLSSLRKSM
ncbi:YciI family protein [Gemmata sp. JC673]|uniref:YciI family protein n=1 Tax=Gemmata algarum TaxID=2975278 RepID=A0ABU5F0M8_9BACT|nr:YciI family protein [Gemmata algarum]MDY3561054.1 YciI family protein [Gemmata algarum]